MAADIERLAGSPAATRWPAAPGPTSSTARGGRDVLDGGAGDDRARRRRDDAVGDTLLGGAGATLDGGAGGDRLAGGDDARRARRRRRCRRPRRRRGDDTLDGGARDDRARRRRGAGPRRGRHRDRHGPLRRGRRGPSRSRSTASPTTARSTPRATDARASRKARAARATTSTRRSRTPRGGGADDTLRRRRCPNAIEGGAGEDVLAGGGGADELSGGERSDAIMARDGSSDRVSCGAGVRLRARRRARPDRPAARCELRRRRQHAARPRARRDVIVDPHCAARRRRRDIAAAGTRAPCRSPGVRGARRRARRQPRLRDHAHHGDGRWAARSARRSPAARARWRSSSAAARAVRWSRTAHQRLPACARRRRDGAHRPRFPKRRYRRRYGRVTVPVTVRADAVRMQTLPSRGRGHLGGRRPLRRGRDGAGHVGPAGGRRNRQRPPHRARPGRSLPGPGAYALTSYLRRT